MEYKKRDNSVGYGELGILSPYLVSCSVNK